MTIIISCRDGITTKAHKDFIKLLSDDLSNNATKK